MNSYRTSTWGDEISLEYGKSLKGYQNSNGKYQVFGSNGPIGWTDKPLCKGPGIILGRKGAYRGVKFSEKDFYVIDTAYYVVPKTDLDLNWLYYAIKYHKLGEIDDGSPIPSTTRAAVYVREFDIPSKEVQVKIGNILKKIDLKIELNNQINETLESIAQSIFKSWFIAFDPVRAKIAAKQEGKDFELAAMCVISGKSEDEIQQMAKEDFAELQATAALFPEEFVESELGEVPKGWEISTVGEQVQAVGGGTPSTKNADFWDNGIHYWTTPRDLSNLTDKILLNTERKITDAGLKKISSGLLPKNTVLMSSRAPVGYLALAKIEVAINQGYIAILPNTKYSAEYLIQWCEANMAEIKGRASGTTFLEISKKNFREINFICSDEKVVTVYTKTAKTLYDEISLKAEENQSLINLRDTLLPKLLSGELDVSSLEEIIHV